MMLHPALQLHLTETNVPCSGSAGNNAHIYFFPNHYIFPNSLLSRLGRVAGEGSRFQLTSGGSDDTLVVKHLRAEVVLTPPGCNT